jgi:hypothetical protein
MQLAEEGIVRFLAKRDAMVKKGPAGALGPR